MGEVRITSFCLEIIPSRKACKESLKSSMRSCSNLASSALISLDTCSNSCLASRARRSAYARWLVGYGKGGGGKTNICDLGKGVSQSVRRYAPLCTIALMVLFYHEKLLISLLPIVVDPYAGCKSELYGNENAREVNDIGHVREQS